jgi:glycosyltransferase involved in cell wall biosynthesis
MTVPAPPLGGRRITVLTTGHLATSPRMTKAADAFAEAGAQVHVVSTRSTAWAVEADADIVGRRAGRWTWDVVDYRRSSRVAWVRSGSRQRSALLLARLIHPERLSLSLAARARERVLPEIVARASRKPADFVYGGGAGLATAMWAGRALGVPFGIDLEDYHPGDQEDTPEGRLFQRLSARIERDVLPAAALRTGGSEDISAEYRVRYGLPVVTVNNAFPLIQDVSGTGSGPLRIYWFSQTIGPGRGLEDAVRAAGIAGIEAELHLQGRASGMYVESLRELASTVAPKLKLVEHLPCFSDDMVEEIARYDVGLCLETKDVLNHDLCLANKTLAYVAAGLALALTDTRGHARLARDLGHGALLYPPGDVRALADALAGWSADKAALSRSKAATAAAARARWNWDNPAEKGELIGAVVKVLRR